MEALEFLTFVTALVALAIGSIVWGADSRPGIEDRRPNL
jgi:hypothetical protein